MTSRSDRIALRAIAAAALFVALATTGAEAAPPSKYHQTGEFIRASGVDSTGCVGYYVEASRGGEPGSAQTFLYVSVYDSCADRSIAWGFGNIPDSALRISPTRASLEFSAAPSSTFAFEGSGGTLRLDVTRTSVWSSMSAGHSRYQYGNVAFQSVGSWTESSASVAGQVLGVEAVASDGSIGRTRDRYVEIQKR